MNGSKLRRLRREKELSLDELGQLCGRSATWVYLLERGWKPVSREGLLKVTKALGMKKIGDVFPDLGQ